jgi:hypothetical protein
MTKLESLLQRKEAVSAAIQIAEGQHVRNVDQINYLTMQYKTIIRDIKCEESCLLLEEGE